MDAFFIWSMVSLAIGLLVLFARSRVKIEEFSVPKPELSYGEIRDWNRQREAYEERNSEKIWTRRILTGASSFFGGFALLLFIMSLFVVVGTNQVGIMTAFGKPQDAHSNGFHGKKPWEIKTEFDGTRQFLRFGGKGNNEEDLDKKEFPCIQVKLEGQATACLSGVVAWQMKADTAAEKKNAVELFKTYRTFERLTKNFVYSSSRVAFGKVFAGHNPLVEDKNQSLGELNDLSLTALKEEFSGELNIMSVDLAVPDYDPATDQSIANVQAQKAKTRLAAEEEATNIAKSKANKALQESLKDPAVNQANCIQAAKETGKEPGFCMMGGGSSVIVDSSTGKN